MNTSKQFDIVPHRFRRCVFGLIVFSLSALMANALESKDGIITIFPGPTASEQIDKATEAAESNTIHTIRFAAGDFHLSVPIRVHKKYGENGIRIEGAGPGLTRLYFSSVKTAIEIILDTGRPQAHRLPSCSVADMTLVAMNDCGTAIKLTKGDNHPTGGISHKILQNLMILTEPGKKAGSWEKGIHVNELTFVTISNLTTRLPSGKGIAILLEGNNNPVDHHLDAIRINQGGVGIEVRGNTEGVYCSHLTMIGPDVGIRWATTSWEPLLLLTASHINAKSCCVELNNILQPLISANSFYQVDPEHPWTAVAILTEKSTPYDLIQISNNQFHGHPGHTVPNTGISINAASSGVVGNNVFSAVDTAVHLGEEVGEIKISGSSYMNGIHEKISKK